MATGCGRLRSRACARTSRPSKWCARVKTHGGESQGGGQAQRAGTRNAKAVVSGVTLSHPDRVYWADAGVSKRDLAEFYTQIWKWMRPHVVGRPIALLRCPEGAAGQCFFQKHATMGIATEHLHLVPEKGDKIISIDDLAGLIALVQAGVLEVHTRGTTIDDRERADRLVFDLDPGPGTGWHGRGRRRARGARAARCAEAQELRQNLRRQGSARGAADQAGALGRGQGFLPMPSPPAWRRMSPPATRRPPTKSKRNKRIFVDYLRNSREATAVAPYSTRARPGAPVSTPIEWSELGALKASNQYTVLNLPARLERLRKDPWAAIGRCGRHCRNSHNGTRGTGPRVDRRAISRRQPRRD